MCDKQTVGQTDDNRNISSTVIKYRRLKIAPKPLEMDTWLLLTLDSLQKVVFALSNAPSPTLYDLPFSHSSAY